MSPLRLSRREMLAISAVTFTDSLIRDPVSVYTQSTTPLPRTPFDEFAQSPSMLATLRKGVSEMKKRKPSDPLSWFYQAAIHGVTDEAVKKATVDDPDVKNVPPSRWNQCPHKGENSANFLPWHRGYTYYFERILRMHTGDDTFSLPYWDYTKKSNRKFPKEFGIKHLDGNLTNDTLEN